MGKTDQGALLGADRPPTPASVLARFFTPGTRGAGVLPTGEDETGAGAGAGAGASAAYGPVRVQLPPQYFAPLFFSTPFYPFTTAALGPGPATALYAQITLQQDQVGIVRGLGLAAVATVVTTQLSAILTVNGSPVEPIRRIPGQPAAYVERLWDDYVYVSPRGATLAVLVTVADAGGPYTISSYLSGWSIPETELQKYLSGV